MTTPAELYKLKRFLQLLAEQKGLHHGGSIRFLHDSYLEYCDVKVWDWNMPLRSHFSPAFKSLVDKYLLILKVHPTREFKSSFSFIGGDVTL